MRNEMFKGALGTGKEDPLPKHDREIRVLIANSLASRSRDEIAKSMSEILGWEISRSMVDAFAACSKLTARFPACLVSAFCDACGDDRLRLKVIGPRLRKRLEFADKVLAAARNRREQRRLIEFTQKSLAAGDDRRELRRLLDELLDEEDYA